MSAPDEHTQAVMKDTLFCAGFSAESELDESTSIQGKEHESYILSYDRIRALLPRLYEEGQQSVQRLSPPMS